MRVEGAPPRPGITMLSGASVALWVGCASSYTALASSAARQCAFVMGASAILAVVALVVARKRFTRVGVAFAALALGVALGAYQAHILSSIGDALAEPLKGEFAVVAQQDSRATSAGESWIGETTVSGVGTVRVLVTSKGGVERRTGEITQVSGELSVVTERQRAYAWQRGSVACMRVWQDAGRSDQRAFRDPLSAFRSHAVDAMQQHAPALLASALGEQGASEALSVTQALACGYKRDVYDTAYEDFKACGLAHLVAVSGAHLVIVTSLFASAFRKIALARKASVGLLIAFMIAYFALAGAPISALRACVMSSIGLMSVFGKRRPHSQNALGIAICLFIIADPSVSVSASFALSSLSTYGIVVFAPLLSFLFEKRLKAPAFVSDPLALTFAAMTCSQLYSCALFSRLPLVSPVANMLSAPLFPLACACSLVFGIMCALGIPGAGLAGSAAGLTAHAIKTLAAFLSSLPHASIPFALDERVALVMTFFIAALLWVLWDRLSRKLIGAACLAITLAFGAWGAIHSGDDAIVMLDVGQGDAFLVTSNGRSLLIDTGNQDQQLLRELGRNGVTKLDGVLLTHADDDHCGSLDALFGNVVVDLVIVAEDLLAQDDEKCRGIVQWASRAREGSLGMRCGDSFVLGDFTMRVVWPYGFTSAGGNEDSLCMVAEYDGDADGVADATALFTGDAEKDQMQAMLDDGSIPHVDILKVGHHGSKNGATAEQLEALGPKIALISVGKNNRYGHPAQNTLEMLDDSGCTVFRTDEDGEVRCALSPSGVRVTRMN